MSTKGSKRKWSKRIFITSLVMLLGIVFGVSAFAAGNGASLFKANVGTVGLTSELKIGTGSYAPLSNTHTVAAGADATAELGVNVIFRRHDGLIDEPADATNTTQVSESIDSRTVTITVGAASGFGIADKPIVGIDKTLADIGAGLDISPTVAGITRVAYTQGTAVTSDAQNNIALGSSNVSYNTGTLTITYEKYGAFTSYLLKINLVVNTLYFTGNGASTTVATSAANIKVDAADQMTTYQLEKGYDPANPLNTDIDPNNDVRNTGPGYEAGDWYVHETGAGFTNGVSTGAATISSGVVTFTGCAAPKVVLNEYSATSHALLAGDSKFYSVAVKPDAGVMGGMLYFKELGFTITLPAGTTATDITLVGGANSRLAVSGSGSVITVGMRGGNAWLNANGDTFQFTFRLGVPVGPEPTAGRLVASNVTYKNWLTTSGNAPAATNGFSQGVTFSPTINALFANDAHASSDSVAIINYDNNLNHREDSTFLGAFKLSNDSGSLKTGVIKVDFPVKAVNGADLRMGVRKVQLPGYAGGGLTVTYGKMHVSSNGGASIDGSGAITSSATPVPAPAVSGGILDITETNYPGGDYEYVILAVEYEYRVADGFEVGASSSNFKKLNTLTGGFYGYFFKETADTQYQLELSRKAAVTDPVWDIIHTTHPVQLRVKSVFTFKTEIVSVGGTAPGTGIVDAALTGGNGYKFIFRFWVVGSAPDMTGMAGYAPSYYVPRFSIQLKSMNYLHIDPRGEDSVKVLYDVNTAVNGESSAAYNGAGAQNMVVNTSTAGMGNGRGLGYNNHGNSTIGATDLSNHYYEVEFLATVDTSVNDHARDFRNHVSLGSIGTSNINYVTVGKPAPDYVNYNTAPLGSNAYTGVLPSVSVLTEGLNMKTTQTTAGLLVGSMVGYRQKSERISGWHNTTAAAGAPLDNAASPGGGSYTSQDKSRIQPFTANGLSYGQYDYRVSMLNNSGGVLANVSTIVPIPKRGETFNGTTYGWSASLYGPVSRQVGGGYVIKYSTAYETNPNAASFQSWNAGNASLYRTVCITYATLPNNAEQRFYFPMVIAEAAPEDHYAAENLVTPLAKYGATPTTNVESTNVYLKTATVRGLTYIDGDFDQQYYPQENDGSKDKMLAGVTILGYRNTTTIDPTTGKQYNNGTIYGDNLTNESGYFNICMYESTEPAAVRVDNPRVHNDMLRFSEYVMQDSPLVANKTVAMNDTQNPAIDGAAFVHNGNEPRQAAEGNDSWKPEAIVTRNLFIPYEAPCTVIFNANGGLMSDNRDGWHVYRYRNHVITQAELAAIVPIWPGHEFLGWHHGSQAGWGGEPWVLFEAPFMINKNMWLYARWRSITYTLTYRVENVDDVHRAWCNEILDRAETPAPATRRAGYRFIGWADESGRIVDVKTERMPARDLTLTAQYARYGKGTGAGTSSSSEDSSLPPKDKPPTGASSSAPEPPIIPAPATSSWSLISAILTVLGVVEALVLLFLVLLRKGKSMAAKLVGILLGILTLPIFFLMNDIFASMIMINISTLIILIVVVVETVLLIIGTKKKKDDEDETDAQAEYGYQ